MRNHRPPALRSGERSPFKDLTNTPTHETTNQAAASVISVDHEEGSQTHALSSLDVPRTPLSNITNSRVNRAGEKPKSGNNWYARMSVEKRAEYNQKRRMARADKKAASAISIDHEEVSQTHASSSLDVPRTPLSNKANSNGTDAAGTSADTDHRSEDAALGRRKRSSEVWYARLSDKEKAEHCKKLRIARLEKKAATTSVQVSPGIAHLGTAQSGVSHMLNSPCSGSSMQTAGQIDWLHTNPTYERHQMNVHGVFDMSVTEGTHGQESFLPGSNSLRSIQMKEVSSEKKRRRMREQYDGLTPEEIEVVLQRKRAYKMEKRHATGGVHPGCHNDGGESDDAGVLEPMDPPAEVDECLHDTRDGQPMYDDDDDDECRIFTGQGDEFESYRVRPDGSHAFEADDPYDYVYKNLPTKHHVLKPVKDCAHCGAIRFQYEGPAFCCRKGKVKSMVSEYARDPKLRTKPDIQSLAKLLGSWPGTDYSISSCRLIVLPYATLDHFILFVINQHAKSVSILDSLGISVASAELKMIQDLRYALKLQRIAFYLNQALEVAHPEWNDDIFYWHRRLPACVPKSTDRNLSGYYAFSSMLLWNGNDLNLPICKDGDQLRKQFLMHLLSYIDNEAAHNIPAVARELISRTRKY